MRNIPAKFTLMGRDFEVVPMIDGKDELDGLYEPSKATIYLNMDHSPQHVRATFCHELQHALLEMAGREDLSCDEKLVDILGNLLYQFLRTSRGKIK